MTLPDLESKTFILLLGAVSVAFAWIIWPFFGAVFWGVVLAIMLAPVYARLVRRVPRRPSVAAMATVLVCVLGVIVPLALLAVALVREGTAMYQNILSRQIDFGAYFQGIVNGLPPWVLKALDALGLGNIAAVQDSLSSGAVEASRFAATHAFNIGQNAFNLVLNLAIVLYLLFFLLRDGPTLAAKIENAIPLAGEQKHDLFVKFAAVIRATIKGNAAIAVVQGVLGGVALALLGIQGALLWGALMAVLSLVPVVGAALVWAPIAVYFLFTGAVFKGVALMVFGVVVIGLVDNLLRPVLVGKDTKMPDYLVLISTLGGIALFGFNGFVIGPLVAALFIAAWEQFTAGQPRSGTPAG